MQPASLPEVVSLEFRHCRVPFRRPFEHAGKRRESGDTLLLGIGSSDGRMGWGEVLPRRYVTGESITDILENRAEALAGRLVGLRFDTQQALVAWLDQERARFPEQMALHSGVDIALWQLFDQIIGLDAVALLGEPRQSRSGQCRTIDFGTATTDLRREAMAAIFSGATMVKLKIGASDDVERLRSLQRHLDGKLPLRLDANNALDGAAIAALLDACDPASLHSIEDPFPTETPAARAALAELHRRFGVPFVADESLTNESDARHIIESGLWQGVNLRLGKLGGFGGTVAVRAMTRAAGLFHVMGSLVGEGQALTDAATLFLDHDEEIEYVEGLGQNRHLLRQDPLEVDARALSNRNARREPVLAPLRPAAAMTDDLLQSRIGFDD
ncbi:MAG: hypothetical protein CSB44_04080 [Gammaproteobacteria bacterium]|nr:MAG: hypothetical protein CSB44_04080 [Gammaproteobacteria bacterium]